MPNMRMKYSTKHSAAAVQSTPVNSTARQARCRLMKGNDFSQLGTPVSGLGGCHKGLWPVRAWGATVALRGLFLLIPTTSGLSSGQSDHNSGTIVTLTQSATFAPRVGKSATFQSG